MNIQRVLLDYLGQHHLSGHRNSLGTTGVLATKLAKYPPGR
jgi:hypothetical protein